MSSGAWSGFVTAALLALFLYGCFWAWSKRRTHDFEEAARLPLEDDEIEKGEQR